MHRRYQMAFLLLAVVLVASGCAVSEGDAQAVVMATTTSVESSGLLSVLTAAFTSRTGYRVEYVAVGTGQALEMGARGDVHLLFVHARDREEEFVARGHGVDRRDVMSNHFILVGPPQDPAGVHGTDNVWDALRSIARLKVPFVSRGDDSGTHLKERNLWLGALGALPSGPWYMESGQGMEGALRLASEKGAYTLTDAATYTTLREELGLVVHAGDDHRLVNQYGVVLVSPGSNHAALAFIDWITGDEAQHLIGSFGVDAYGEPLFRPQHPDRAEESRHLAGEAVHEPPPVSRGLGEWLLVTWPDIWSTVRLSLLVSGTAVLAAAAVGLPLGAVLALSPESPARRAVILVANAFMGLPPVLAGLVVYLILSARGPLGDLQLLFTPQAMVLAQALLALPIVTALSHAAVRSVPAGIRDAARTLGASAGTEMLTLVREARAGLGVVVAAGLGRALAEVGAVMMVGGNIAGRTRVMTTAIVLETRRGNFQEAVVLSAVLLFLSMALNGLITAFNSRGGRG